MFNLTSCLKNSRIRNTILSILAVLTASTAVYAVNTADTIDDADQASASVTTTTPSTESADSAADTTTEGGSPSETAAVSTDDTAAVQTSAPETAPVTTAGTAVTAPVVTSAPPASAPSTTKQTVCKTPFYSIYIQTGSNCPTAPKLPIGGGTAATTKAPAVTAAPATTAAPSSSLSEYAQAVFNSVNAERQKAGLSTLSYDGQLDQAANVRAQEIVQSFSHTRPDGRSTFSILSDLGISYTSAGENIAYGQRSPEEVMTGWMNSEGHRANILNSNFTSIGVGVYKSGNTLYWVQLFKRG